QTAELADRLNAQHPIDLVATVGDHVHPDATTQAYADCYAPTWGRYREITLPAIGNHDRPTRATLDYFNLPDNETLPGTLDLTLYDYGVYSVALDTWLFVFLNIDVPTTIREQQRTWLDTTLAASDAACTAAFWHQPLFSSGTHGGYTPVREFWQILETHGADLVFNGHDHHYERFEPQTSIGQAWPTGIQQFVVGTGGYYLYDVGTPLANSAFHLEQEWGVLELTLYTSAYSWKFINLDDEVMDGGALACR
ncbi:MAG: metallophosphoesterase, partial [Chloroflexota bacterium]